MTQFGEYITPEEVSELEDRARMVRSLFGTYEPPETATKSAKKGNSVRSEKDKGGKAAKKPGGNAVSPEDAARELEDVEEEIRAAAEDERLDDFVRLLARRVVLRAIVREGEEAQGQKEDQPRVAMKTKKSSVPNRDHLGRSLVKRYAPRSGR